MSSTLRHLRIDDDVWDAACATLVDGESPTQLVTRLLREHASPPKVAGGVMGPVTITITEQTTPQVIAVPAPPCPACGYRARR